MSRILVIEDDASLRNAVVYALEEEGFEVSTAVNGMEALLSLSRGAQTSVGIRDVALPVLRRLVELTGLTAQQTVYYDGIYREGKITGANAISAFSINGEPLSHRKSRQLFFGYLAFVAFTWFFDITLIVVSYLAVLSLVALPVTTGRARERTAAEPT